MPAAWPTIALYTLQELRDFINPASNERDALYAAIAGWVAGDLERATQRRLVFRAPTEDDDLIYTGNFTNGTPAALAQPTAPGRTIVVTFPAGATGGTVTISGNLAGGGTGSEVFTVPALIVGSFVSSLVQYGVKYFSGGVTITIGGATGSGTVKIGVSQGYIDYFSPNRMGCTNQIWSNEWPVRHAILYEDPNRAYTTPLVDGTDYVVADQERFVRVCYGGTARWVQAFRAIKALNAAGYFGSAAIPGTIKRIALRLAALYDKEANDGQIEIASGSSAIGSWTRSGQAALTPQMLRDLGPFSRKGYFDGAERGYDLEAA